MMVRVFEDQLCGKWGSADDIIKARRWSHSLIKSLPSSHNISAAWLGRLSPSQMPLPPFLPRHPGSYTPGTCSRALQYCIYLPPLQRTEDLGVSDRLLLQSHLPSTPKRSSVHLFCHQSN